MDPISVLLDDRYTVPAVPPATTGVAWLRSQVVRFSEREDHRRRRVLVESLLAAVDPASLDRSGDHVATLARALGLPGSVAADVRTVAGSYQPHTGITPQADGAVADLVAACGGSWDERTANVLGILVQACDSTARLIAGDPVPVPATRRIGPDGAEVHVDLTDAPFGAGRHACPGRRHAEALAAGANRFLPRRHERVVGPELRPVVAGVPGEVDAGVGQRVPEPCSPRGGVHEQDPQLRGSLVGTDAEHASTRAPSRSAIQAASHAGSWRSAYSATMRQTSAAKLVSHPNSAS